MNVLFLPLVAIFLSAAAAASPVSHVPMMFERNDGQFAAGVDFVARGPGYLMAVKRGELLMSLRDGKEGRALVRSRLAGAQVAGAAAGEAQMECRMSYFLGDDPAQWRTEVPTFAKVRCAGVYPGVDLLYYGNQREIEYDFIVAPGADPGQVTMEFDNEVRLDAVTGELVIGVNGGELRHRAPVSYQVRGGRRVPVASRYVLSDGGRVTFALGDYDRSRALVIDPVLTFSTYFGSVDNESAVAMAVDAAGNQYLAGNTDGDAKFTSSNLSRTFNGGDSDAFVLKMRPEGNVIDRGTLIGGSGADEALAIAVDDAGSVYLAGTTDSAYNQSAGIANTLPYAPPPPAAAKPGYDRDANGGLDAFVVKINATFTAVDYSTFLGGSGTDAAHGIAVAGNGHVWVSGMTSSAAWHFPGSATWAYDTSFGGGTLPYDGFLVKLDTTAATGQGLEFFTYLGGTETDEARGVAVDSQGNVAVTGFTFSTNFPTHLALQPARAGGADAFLTRFSADGSTLLSSTYFGGTESEFGDIFVKFDSNNRPYLCGATRSANLPVINAAQPVFGGGMDTSLNIPWQDIFVTRLNAAATGIEFSTFIGGNDDDEPMGLAVDSEFNVYVAGWTASPNFPLNHADDTTLGGTSDGVLVKLNADGNHINFGTYIGGGGRERATGVSVIPGGTVFVAGWTESSDFHVTPGALQTSQSGTTRDLFFRRYGISTQPPAVTISSPPGSPRAHLLPFTGTVDDNDISGVAVRVQIMELNPVVRYWTGAAWTTVPAGEQGPWLAAVRNGVGWSMDPAFLPGRAQTSPGTYTLRAQAEDGDGNLSAVESVNVVRSDADTTPPVITFTRPAVEGEVLTGSSPALTFTVTDAETGVGVVLATLRKTENGQTTYWNGTGWQTDLDVHLASQSGDNFSFPDPPSGAQRPNAEYLLVVSASNLESTPLNATGSIGFSVDFHPSYTWTGLAGNNSWIDPANWSSTDAPGSFPIAGAVAVIDSGSPAIAGGSDVYLQQLRIAGSGSLTVFGTLAVAKKLEVFGGALHGMVTLHGGTESTWAAGTITGALTIAENAVLTVSGLSDYKYLGADARPGSITNRGTIRWTGDTAAAAIRGWGGTGAATINNEATGVFDIAGNGQPFYYVSAANLVFTNRGRIVKSAGTGLTALDYGHVWTFNLESGSVFENAVADPAAVLYRSGPAAVTNVKAGAVFRGPGRINFAGGTPLNATEAGAWTIDNAATLELAGMSLACPQTGDLTLEPSADSTLLWTAGTIHGNLRIPAGVTLTVTGLGDYKYLGAAGKPGTIHNAGILLWTGNSSAESIRGYGGDGPATINNLPHARFHIAGDGYPLYYVNGTNCVFNNDGRIIKTAGAGITTFDYSNLWVLNNSTGAFIENAVPGSVLERSGPAAVTNIADGPVFYGPGTIRFSGGTPLNAAAGAWNIAGNATLLLDGMTLRCPQAGSLTLQPSAGSTLRWTAGTIHGNLVIPAAATLEVTGLSDYKYLGAANLPATLTNHGTIRWTGDTSASAIRGFGDTGAVTINNEAAGVFDIAGNGQPFYHVSAANLVFTNRGRIVKSAGNGLTALDYGQVWTFNLESGSVLENAVADSAAVLYRNGPAAITNVKAGAIFRGPGRLQFAGGTPLNATETGAWTIDNAAMLELAGMVLNCPTGAGLTLQATGAAAVTWTAGTIYGVLNIPSGTALTVTGTSDYKYLGAAGQPGNLNNAGTVTWTNGWPIRGYGGTGPATLHNLPGGVLNLSSSGNAFYHQAATNNTLINAGAMHIGASPGAVDGTWHFTQTATGTLHIEVAGPAPAEYDRLVFGGTATLGGTVSVTRLNGYTPAEGTLFPFLTAGSVAGTFAIVAGGFAAEYTGTTATLRSSPDVPLTFNDWAAANNLTGNDALPDADPDKDGYDNFFEYVHNLNPGAASGPPDTTGTTTIAGQQFLTLSYRRYDDREAAGVAYTPQTGTGLGAWETAGIIEEVDPNAPVIPGSTACRCRVPISGTALKFLRVKAVKP